MKTFYFLCFFVLVAPILNVFGSCCTSFGDCNCINNGITTNFSNSIFLVQDLLSLNTGLKTTVVKNETSPFSTFFRQSDDLSVQIEVYAIQIEPTFQDIDRNNSNDNSKFSNSSITNSYCRYPFPDNYSFSISSVIILFFKKKLFNQIKKIRLS